MVAVVVTRLAVLTVAGGHDLTICREEVVCPVVVLAAFAATHRSRA